MPVFSDSSFWSWAIQSLPSVAPRRSSSSAGSKPSRMMPPSLIVSGGSSAIAREIRPVTSGSSCSWPPSSLSNGGGPSGSASSKISSLSVGATGSMARCTSAIMPRSIGNWPSAPLNCTKSRALPEPMLNRLIVRSRSRISFRLSRNRSSAGLLWRNWPSAVCRRRIASTDESGCESQSRSRRAPIGVEVRFSAA